MPPNTIPASTAPVKRAFTRDVATRSCRASWCSHLIDRYRRQQLSISASGPMTTNYYLSPPGSDTPRPRAAQTPAWRTGEITRRQTNTTPTHHYGACGRPAAHRRLKRLKIAAPPSSLPEGRSNSTCARGGLELQTASTSNPIEAWSTAHVRPHVRQHPQRACSSAPATPSTAPDAGP